MTNDPTTRGESDDQAFVADMLRSLPPPDVPAGFLARVNARIDERAGWFGIADFRVWTLRLAPLAAGLGLVAVLWPATAAVDPSSSASAATTASAAAFSPASQTDWQQDVSTEALLDAALQPPAGGARVR